MKTPQEYEIDFEVVGAGVLRISKEANGLCGNAVGFSFGVSWGRHEFTGGVMSRSEALRLARHIIEECEKCTMSEEEELIMRYNQIAGK